MSFPYSSGKVAIPKLDRGLPPPAARGAPAQNREDRVYVCSTVVRMHRKHADAMLIEQEPARIVASEVSSLYVCIGPDPLANVQQRSSVLAMSHAAPSAKQTISAVFTSNHGAIA